jgi:hypothetical protein
VFSPESFREIKLGNMTVAWVTTPKHGRVGALMYDFKNPFI